MTEPVHREPALNVPPAVLAMALVLIAIHVLRQFLSENADEELLLALAFIPARYGGHAPEWAGGGLASLTSPVTYMLLHGDISHLGLNTASLVAFGAILERRLSSMRFVVFTLVCGIAGAFTFLAFNWELASPLIGASGAISGMMAASLRILFSALDTAPGGRAGEMLRNAPRLIAVKPLGPALADRKMILAVGAWLGINALAAYGLGTPGQAGLIAWEAHIGGFIAGLLLLGAVDGASRRERIDIN